MLSSNFLNQVEIMKKITPIILLISISIITIIAHQLTRKPIQKVSITRIWSDENGESHFGTKEIEIHDCGTIGSISNLIPGSGVMFRKTPANYNFSWHTAPRKQFIVNLDAAIEIEVSDGEVKTIKSGDVFFVEDTWGKGHISKSVDDKERMSLFIPTED